MYISYVCSLHSFGVGCTTKTHNNNNNKALESATVLDPNNECVELK